MSQQIRVQPTTSLEGLFRVSSFSQSIHTPVRCHSQRNALCLLNLFSSVFPLDIIPSRSNTQSPSTFPTPHFLSSYVSLLNYPVDNAINHPYYYSLPAPSSSAPCGIKEGCATCGRYVVVLIGCPVGVVAVLIVLNHPRLNIPTPSYPHPLTHPPHPLTNTATTTTTTLLPSSSEKRSLSTPLAKLTYTGLPLTSTYTGELPTVFNSVKPSITLATQPLGIVNVNTCIRSPVYETATGLVVVNPLLPTKEYVAGLKSISSRTGKPITDVVLASTAVEHAGPLGAFSQRFPSATYWLPPGLYSFPVNLPRKFLGLLARDVRPLPPSTSGPLASLGFTWTSLGPLKFKVRKSGERSSAAMISLECPSVPTANALPPPPALAVCRHLPRRRTELPGHAFRHRRRHEPLQGRDT